jgi:GTPase
VTVKGIHYKRVAIEKAIAGQAVCFHIKGGTKKDPLKRENFRKGMMIVDRTESPNSSWEFTAEVTILYNATTIKSNYQAVVHCGVI